MIMIHDGENGGGPCGQQPRTDDWFNQTVTRDKLLAKQFAVSHRQSLPSVNYHSKAYTEQWHTITANSTGQDCLASGQQQDVSPPVADTTGSSTSRYRLGTKQATVLLANSVLVSAFHFNLSRWRFVSMVLHVHKDRRDYQ